MSFMQPEIVFETFEIFETREGTMCVPAGTLSSNEILELINVETDPLHCLTDLTQAKEVDLYELKEGWFARLSAPGYMDCTDWCGPFKSEEEANKYLLDTYGDDDAED